MAIYHCSVQIIGRSSGRSSVAAAAYRAGIKMKNERDGVTHDYSRRKGVVYSEIMLPKFAPDEYMDRTVLWNTVEKGERRCDAQTAREVEVSIPVEFNPVDRVKVVQDYINENFISDGMIADFSIHDNDGNPHAHIMLTMRDVEPSGFTKKNRAWNATERLEQWRESWAHVCNRALEERGFFSRIDHRSLEAQGLERTPTIHTGYSPIRKSKNLAIIKENECFKPHAVAQYMAELDMGCAVLQKEITEIQNESYHNEREMRNIKATVKEIEQRVIELRKMDDNRLQVIKERDNMKFYQSKKSINADIERLNYTYKHAWDYFERSYGVNPNEAYAEVVRLSQRYNTISQSRNVVTQYIERLHEFETEYKRQRLLAVIRLDGIEILEMTDKLNTRLNHVSNEDYKVIEPHLRPSQIEILHEKLSNRTREHNNREHERRFYQRTR